jgi:hypothetical protein
VMMTDIFPVLFCQLLISCYSCFVTGLGFRLCLVTGLGFRLC